MQNSFVKRPYHSQERAAPSENIFAHSQDLRLPLLPSLAKKQDQDYHLVGPTHLRQQILHELNPQPQRDRLESLERLEERRSLPSLSGTVPLSVGRESVLSKLGQHERKALTRDKRNLEFYKEYQQYWQRSSRRIRESTGSGHATLLQGSVKRLLVVPNPEKEELLKNYVNSYWEMSLRNNNLILKRHIKGENRYGEVEMEGLLQSQEGTKLVEKAIPRLPVERLQAADHRAFALTGRNKLACESVCGDPSLASQFTARLSKAMTDGAVLDRNQQILKMSYDSSHSFLREAPN